MAQEAKVRVRLDTKNAKSDLRELNKQASGTAQGVGGRMRKGFGKLALGTGAVLAGAAGLNAMRATSGGLFSDAGSYLGSHAEDLLPFDMAKKGLIAQAAKEARSGLPHRLLGSQTSAKRRKAVRDASLPGFLIRQARSLERLEGAKGFLQDARFGGPGTKLLATLPAFTRVLEAIATRTLARFAAILLKRAGLTTPLKKGGGKK